MLLGRTPVRGHVHAHSSARCSSCSLRRSSLPVGVRGSASTACSQRGRWCGGSRLGARPAARPRPRRCRRRRRRTPPRRRRRRRARTPPRASAMPGARDDRRSSSSTRLTQRPWILTSESSRPAKRQPPSWCPEAAGCAAAAPRGGQVNLGRPGVDLVAHARTGRPGRTRRRGSSRPAPAAGRGSPAPASARGSAAASARRARTSSSGWMSTPGEGVKPAPSPRSSITRTSVSDAP